MILRIERLLGLGIFSDFSWGAGLRNFGRYNIIYGWNGSGKTTFSNLLAGLPAGSMASHPNATYAIETDLGTRTNGQPLPTKTRVFNRDYVANNVHTLNGKARPILILGEENKKVSDDIQADESTLAAKREQLRRLEKDSADTITRRDKIFSEIAKTISLNTSGSTTRTYRKPDAARDFELLRGKALLDESEIDSYTLELRQQEKPDVAEIATLRLSLGGEQKDIANALAMASSRGLVLCAQTVTSTLVERLKLNGDIAQWVEQGIALHTAHASRTCEFCDQTLPLERMRRLAAHFSEADQKLKDDIDALLKILAAIEAAIRARQYPDKANLYDELQRAYLSSADRFAAAANALLAQIGALRISLEAKKAKTTESVALEEHLDGSELVAALEAANAEISKHNQKTANFTAAKNAARKALEAHYLSTVFDEVMDLEKKAADNKLKVEKTRNGNEQVAGDIGIANLMERIEINRARISSSHKGCLEINSALRTFLGRDELQFEVDEEGYVLKRGSQIAENLSEGEKTAIGFVHFVIHLKNHDFDPASGIVVIDDPISSLDSSSMFQAFAFLKNSVKDAHQVFVLTHNFDFLRLLINWIKGSRQPLHCYMIKNAYDASNKRTASIEVLDRLLERHESEYHYIFKILYSFQSDGTIESVYNMPNIARKALETFLMFRVPNSENNYRKLEALKPHFDPNKLTAIHKFTNDQSHITGKGFDPSLVVETQKNVKYLLEMIATVFPEHYTILVASISG